MERALNNIKRVLGTLVLSTIVFGPPILFGISSIQLANKTISEVGTWIWIISGLIVLLEVISLWIGLLAIVYCSEEEDKDEVSTNGDKRDN